MVSILLQAFPRLSACFRVPPGLLGRVLCARDAHRLSSRACSLHAVFARFDSTRPSRWAGCRGQPVTKFFCVLRLLFNPVRPAQPPPALSSFSLLSSSPFSLRFCTTSQLYTLAVATSMVWQAVSTDSPPRMK